MTTDNQVIWMDGKMVKFQEASVHFLNTALHYGLGVFEGIRCYATDRGPAIFRLREHMERLVNSAKILGFRQLPFDVDQLCEAARDVVRKNEFKSCYIRPLVFHENEKRDLNLDSGYARIGIGAWEWGTYLGEEAMEKGARMNISSLTRHHANVMMTKAKITGNYANSVMAKTESFRLGFDEAIMLDPQGYVAECTGENLFIVRKGVIYTPGTWAILEGITREALMLIASDMGLKVMEQQISRDHLYVADECFCCGTAAEVVPVTEIDFRVIGSGKMGPITRSLQQEYRKLVTGKHPRSEEWLDYVNA
jgi:branched-chain amino acid aminotransferase